VREHGVREAEDDDIWSFAKANGAIVVTKDSDFSIRSGREGNGPTIPWIRVGNTTSPDSFAILEHAWAAVELDLPTEPVVEVR
jgi:predicted nuclease of predicted toxin-antitoxin system